jgi:hypothetical protein
LALDFSSQNKQKSTKNNTDLAQWPESKVKKTLMGAYLVRFLQGLKKKKKKKKKKK